MNYNPDRHHRHSIRLKGYDYSRAGAYFVTVCTRHRECLFGDMVDGTMHLNDSGRLVQDAWDALPQRFPTIDLDAFVVMPNHIHGIIVICPENMGTYDGTTRDTIVPVGAALAPPLRNPSECNPSECNPSECNPSECNPSECNPSQCPPLNENVGPRQLGARQSGPRQLGARQLGARQLGARQLGAQQAAPLRVNAVMANAPLGKIVRAFKSISAIAINRVLGRGGHSLWQRNYYEHIIRDDDALNQIRNYVMTNPSRWECDQDNPYVIQGNRPFDGQESLFETLR